MPTECLWYVADFDTATGPSDYVAYNGWTAALAATSGFGSPSICWGSVDAFWNSTGIAAYVEIDFDPGVPKWSWGIGLVGVPFADGTSGFLTADAALAAAQASPFLPAEFCVNPTHQCDPNSLLESAKCFACIPKGKLREIQIYLLYLWLARQQAE